jgi:hypothetical protein
MPENSSSEKSIADRRQFLADEEREITAAFP